MIDASSNAILADLLTAFSGADYDSVPGLVRRGIDEGVEPQRLMDEGLTAGIREVGEMFRRGDAFLPEMLLAAEAWQKGLDVLEPLLAGGVRSENAGTIVIGAVKGDIHSLGKNIVATMLRTAGFTVVDLGTDVAASRFIAAAADAHADAIALCALMTTTMPQQREVIEHLVAAGRRGEVRVMIGGSAATAAWAEEIGADGYGETAADAVALAQRFVAGTGGSASC